MGAQKKQKSKKKKIANRRQSKKQQLRAFLKKQYYNPKEPGSYGGVTRLLEATQEKFENLPSKKKRVVNRIEVEKWLEAEEAYPLHKPVRRKFPRNRVYVTYKDQHFKADLVDMSHLSKYNDGYRYLLTCIDILSKYVWVVPLKNKSGENVAKAFQSILTSSGRNCTQSRGRNFTIVSLEPCLDCTILSISAGGIRKSNVVLWKDLTGPKKPECIDISLKNR